MTVKEDERLLKLSLQFPFDMKEQRSKRSNNLTQSLAGCLRSSIINWPAYFRPNEGVTMHLYVRNSTALSHNVCSILQ